MPMQIGLDELLSMLLARMDGLTLESENQKSRFNILFRVLYKKGLFNEEDVLDAVREEHRILKELGMTKETPSEDALKETAKGMMLWIKGDVAAIRSSMEDYDRQMKEAMAQQQKPRIDVAPAAVLDELDRLGGTGQGGKKLIL
ncbi:MAG: hypothetical protein IJR68_07740 [Fretibacterium sp.]|nr:hypothetical protein [Fretibacterium sp.]MBQ9564164.1 hypothetical protein [Synergistaceae bacterium]